MINEIELICKPDKNHRTHKNIVKNHDFIFIFLCHNYDVVTNLLTKGLKIEVIKFN